LTLRIGDTEFFKCGKNYGVFVRPNKVEMGDFPELDLDDEI
jgi:tubulin-folding cofactor B